MKDDMCIIMVAEFDTSNGLLENTTSGSVLTRRFVHPCQFWPAVYRQMRRGSFILHSFRYDCQSFLIIGVLPSPCGSNRVRTSNSPAAVSKISSFVQGRCPKLHHHASHLSFYRDIMCKGTYMYSANFDALVGGTMWMMAAMSTT